MSGLIPSEPTGFPLQPAVDWTAPQLNLSWAGARHSGQVAGVDACGQAELAVLAGVFERCHNSILQATQQSPIPAAFLAALTANESGGDPEVSRFALSVYVYLKQVAANRLTAHQGRGEPHQIAESSRALPKTLEFHDRYLTRPFGRNNQQMISSLKDHELHQLACSWGFTQIMGYHMVSRSPSVRELLEPEFHYRLAAEILADFGACYQLDLAYEFEEMFRCWNTGQPYGRTSDPAYVENGLRRMGLYAEMTFDRRAVELAEAARNNA